MAVENIVGGGECVGCEKAAEKPECRGEGSGVVEVVGIEGEEGEWCAK
jgi:hypothetical protein